MNLHPNCWNEYSELKSVVVCSPSSLDVPNKDIASYVQWEAPAKYEKAIENHENMVNGLKGEGVHVVNYDTYLSEEDLVLHRELINRVFVRDLACVFGNHIVPGEAGTTMRRPEYVTSHLLFKNWFDEKTFSIKGNNQSKALEFGDAMILNSDAVFINAGLRTSIDSIEAIKEQVFQAGFSEIGVIDLPRRGDTLHMDMNCNVVGEDVFLAKSYMRYFPVKIIMEDTSIYMMMEAFLNRHGYEVVWTDEITHTVADINFLNLNPETLLISTKANKKILKSHPKLKKKKLIEVDVDELEKGSGGIRCMTLPIERS
ncbi:arginine deiminase family protein [Guptibacillus algicola]|uniref:arginine deiminase family protein n=1 Tax=Guptibacillus algicola TaxID=225844 RepID=UPI001CD58ABB|nr:arginine deiminase family protein [Alkalihalobacillus algicola]MCA0989525.1 arginine deiminase [Alkalihalobacillus algicola]